MSYGKCMFIFLNNFLPTKKNRVGSLFLIGLCEFFIPSEYKSFVGYKHSTYLLVCDLPFILMMALILIKYNLSTFYGKGLI